MRTALDYIYAGILFAIALALFGSIVAKYINATQENSPEYLKEISEKCKNVAKEKGYGFFTIVKASNPNKNDFCYIAKNNDGYPDIRIPIINGFVEKHIFQNVEN